MSRFPKVSPVTQDEPVSTNGQLSLFSPTREGEGPLVARTEEKTVSRTKKNAAYSAADIQVLEGIAAIRHRPGMYIGSTSTSGLLHLLWEALDNAVDEAVVGFGKHIWISIDREGWVTVRDEARGMGRVYSEICNIAISNARIVPPSVNENDDIIRVASLQMLDQRLELTVWLAAHRYRPFNSACFFGIALFS